MGLDSVEIVMGWEKSFGITIADAEAEVLRTPSQSMELMAAKLSAREVPRQSCLTLRAFHRLRRAIMAVSGVSRADVRPEARLKDLLSKNRRCAWESVRAHCGISSLPDLGWFSPRTLGDITRWAVANAAKDLKRPGEPWTHSEIRSVVRAVVMDVTGKNDFRDDDDFIHDIGID